jgi:hypothetical protein
MQTDKACKQASARACRQTKALKCTIHGIPSAWGPGPVLHARARAVVLAECALCERTHVWVPRAPTHARAHGRDTVVALYK